jgi:N-glycosylase/DNA lyase
MQELKTVLMKTVLDEYPRLANSFNARKKWTEMSETELWHEMCLCILSSNVPYQLAKSATLHLIINGYLGIDWITNTTGSEKIIAKELSKPIYLPEKKNGNHRKYRFPNVRSKNILQAAKTIFSHENLFFEILFDANSEEKAREFLVRNISGLGLKQASHFLRNIGYSNGLAIIDTHIIRFLINIGAVEKRDVSIISPKIYHKLEAKLQEICRSHHLNLSIFDMTIWYCSRGA